jgi:hypothetical protein
MANVPSSLILVTLMMAALSSSETSVLTIATWRTIPEDAILHSHHRENLKSYICLAVLKLSYTDIQTGRKTQIHSNDNIHILQNFIVNMTKKLC